MENLMFIQITNPTILKLLFPYGLFIFFIAARCLYLSSKAGANSKDGCLVGGLLPNPEKLTEEGKYYRQKCLKHFYLLIFLMAGIPLIAIIFDFIGMIRI